jgi:hypothetical protein
VGGNLFSLSLSIEGEREEVAPAGDSIESVRERGEVAPCG